MWRSRRGLWLWVGGAAAFAAVAGLVWQGIRLTLLLERQASLVFESSAGQEARALLPDLERAIRTAEEEALAALAALPPGSKSEALETALQSHPLIEVPFLLAADRTLLYPPSPGQLLESMAAEDPPPEVFLHARRLSLSGALSAAGESEALASLSAVSAAPELASAWRLRARAAMAARHLRAGRAAEAAAAYASLAGDFPEELREIVHPSRAQLAAAQALALAKAGRHAEGRVLVLSVLRDLQANGAPEAAIDDSALLLRKAEALAEPTDGAGFLAELEAFRSWHAAHQRTRRFARALPQWIVPRLLRGETPERFEERLEGERFIVSWRRGEESSGLAAIGFSLEKTAARDICAAAMAEMAAKAAAGAGGDLRPPLSVELAPARPEFMELAALPGALQGIRIGTDRAAWQTLLGQARGPFRLAAGLIAVLGLSLGLGAGLVILAVRREAFLARMKTEFVANVSHELKTPLALIRLFGETLLLDRVRDPAKARGYYEVIVRESERLTHLVNNVLDFSSIEAGRKRFDLRPCDLGRVIEEVIGAYRLPIEERGFRLNLEIAGGLPEVNADPEAAAQALINLLDNALKYTVDRKEIEVRAGCENGTVRIAVADGGIGIAPSEIKRVFETFYRSPAARRLGTRGSGLGLSLVQHIMKAHGGSVELESAPGRGSTFTLVFPLTDQRAEAQA